jgi:hypothetical protein
MARCRLPLSLFARACGQYFIGAVGNLEGDCFLLAVCDVLPQSFMRRTRATRMTPVGRGRGAALAAPARGAGRRAGEAESGKRVVQEVARGLGWQLDGPDGLRPSPAAGR